MIGNVCVQEPDVRLVDVFCWKFYWTGTRCWPGPSSWAWCRSSTSSSSTTCSVPGPLSSPACLLTLASSSILLDVFMNWYFFAGKFMTVLCLFLIGFSMLITAMNTPFFDDKLMEVILRIICFHYNILRKPSSRMIPLKQTHSAQLCLQKSAWQVGKLKNSRTAKLSFPDSAKQVVIHFFVGFSSYFSYKFSEESRSQNLLFGFVWKRTLSVYGR